MQLLGISLDDVRMDFAVAEIMRLLDAPGQVQIHFVNAHCVNVACADAAYADVLRRAAMVLPDGIGVRLGTRFLGQEVRDNVNGTDLFPRLCEALGGSGKRVYLLGGRPGVVEGALSWIATHHPDVLVAGAHHGYLDERNEDTVIANIRGSGADLLLVGMGVPIQEKWIDRNLHRCGVRVAMGVGALFDFYSSTVPRAPLWMRHGGLEWAWRLALEPRRMWRRYLVGNPLFLVRVALQRLSGQFARQEPVA